MSIFRPPDRITTNRLVLTRWSPNHAPLLKAAIDSSLEHLQAWMPWATAEPTLAADIARRLAQFGADFEAGRRWLYGIFVPDESSVVGGLGLHPSGTDQPAVDIGYWLRSDVTGRGFATEAVRAATNLPGVAEAYIHCDPRNQRSAAVARRLGFRHVTTLAAAAVTPSGEPRDTMVWRRGPSTRFAPPAVTVERRPDGTVHLRNPTPLGTPARAVGEWLEHWAVAAPARPFLQERGPNGDWVGPTYAEALDQVKRIATWLLRQELSADRPVAVLSDNSVEHALLSLAAMHVGIPVAPVSPAYSTQSRDFGKLKSVLDQATPGVIYVADAARFAPALAAVGAGRNAGLITGGAQFQELLGTLDEGRVADHFQDVGPETIAKFLFTSGSTGSPKAVINTQAMLTASQQARVQVWPFLADQPPVIVDWLPWSHTFGGNHNFNLVLRNGGTLYIDGGRPVPGLFETTVANLKSVAPTIYFNVPRGYDMLVTALQADPELRRHFLSRLQVIFYAAAALPPHLWDDLTALALEAAGGPVMLTSGWGSTETAPLATDCHFQASQSGVIGLPVPGTELKLVPNGNKLEVRVRGPNVTPGYWRRPDLTAAHFDEDRFYRIGDAVRFVDRGHPEMGILFDGRVAEDFKLDTGTWVNVGMLRVRAIAALAPVAQDIVVAGHDRPTIGFLVFPNLPGCRQLASELEPAAPVEAVLAHPAVREAVQRGLERLRSEGQGSSGYGARAVLLIDPPSIDHGEITDKAYLNQRAVLDHRAAIVDALYRDNEPGVITPRILA